MSHTYYTAPSILPESKMKTLLPRPQGDGMDSETLKIQELIPSSGPNLTGRRHHNLAFSPKTTTIAKNSKPIFVPYEPVKGAVKPITDIPASSFSTNKSPPQSMRKSPDRKTKTILNGPNTDVSCQKNINSEISSKVQKEKFPVTPEKMGKDVVMTIKVPFYNAPSHLSHGTYQMMQKQFIGSKSVELSAPSVLTNAGLSDNLNKLRAIETGMAPKSSEQNDDVMIKMEDLLQDLREVEGDNRTASMADLEKLNDEINELRHELERQVKINGDLKKLLVASMGDDLHYKVERLVQDKVQLTQEVGDYSKKLHQDYEDLDKLAIQADLWRSKFKASRLMVDEMRKQNSSFMLHYQSSHQALQRLLQERQQMKIWLTQTHRQLHHVQDAFKPRHTPKPTKTGPQTLLSLTLANQSLSEDVKFRLLGPIKSSDDDWDVGTIDALSPAEAYAFHVLSSEFPGGAASASTLPGSAGSMPYTIDKITRFHLDTKDDNLTINCCSKCKGELRVL